MVWKKIPLKSSIGLLATLPVMASGTSKRSQKKKNKKKPTPAHAWRTAKTADRHELYELSVQNVEAEVELVQQFFSDLGEGDCTRVREDFCGTGHFSAAWASSATNRFAIGVDLDLEVLEWGRKKLISRLDEDAQNRVELLQGDVLQTTSDPVDAVLATNFSYYLFKTREEIKNYFSTARKQIRSGGIFIMDAYGGSESFEEQEEERDLDGFTYVWDQSHYNPITGDVVNHIHFRFPDGSEMNKAFTYEWRLWTLPELQELLIEAGFQSVKVYWEGTVEEGDDAGEGDGEFKQTQVGEACQGWIAYLVAQP